MLESPDETFDVKVFFFISQRPYCYSVVAWRTKSADVIRHAEIPALTYFGALPEEDTKSSAFKKITSLVPIL